MAATLGKCIRRISLSSAKASCYRREAGEEESTRGTMGRGNKLFLLRYPVKACADERRRI